MSACSESAVFFLTFSIVHRTLSSPPKNYFVFYVQYKNRNKKKMRIRISYAPHLPFRSVSVRLCGIHTHAHHNNMLDAKLIHRDGKIIIYYFELVWLADKSKLFIFFIGQVVAEYVFTYTHAHSARTHSNSQKVKMNEMSAEYRQHE